MDGTREVKNNRVMLCESVHYANGMDKEGGQRRSRNNTEKDNEIVCVYLVGIEVGEGEISFRSFGKQYATDIKLAICVCVCLFVYTYYIWYRYLMLLLAAVTKNKPFK